MLCVLYEQRDITTFLLVECLGLVPVTADNVPRTLCNDDESRAAAYAILTSLCNWRPSIVYQVLRHLDPVFRSVPPLSVWDYKPERDVRSSTGFVGLRNKGCTCYMNSLLQVLYMVPEVREGILATQTASNASEAASSNDIVLQLQRLFFNLKYGEKKAFSPDDWVFAYKDESGLLPVNVSQQQDAQEFLQVLCERLSAQESQGQGRGTSCTPLAGSVDSSRGADAGEQREGSSSSASASASVSTGSKVSLVGELLKSSFGGKICNQMLLESPTETPKADGKEKEKGNKGSSGVREQEDPFVCLSLQVKDAKGLEHSLAQFVEGEKIEDYQWDDDGPRVTISKRQCISQLSDTLIFHLKRFELNFDTFRREKVNDSFSFPMYLNMLPYTKEGLTPTHLAGDLSAGLGEGGEGEGARSNAYYQYELTGVVVHSGTTDSGHYYAYIKDKGDDSNPNTDNHDNHSSSSPTVSSFASSSSSQSASNPSKNTEKRTDRDRKTYRWLEFNDSEVSEFPESRLEAECFGGTTKSYDYSVSTISEVETVNPKSAYMLVYRRVRTLRPPPAPTVATPHPSTLSAPGSVTDRSAEDVVTLIKRENARHTMMLRLADQVNLATVGGLLKRVVEAYPHPHPYPYPHSSSADLPEGQRQSVQGALSLSLSVPHSMSVLPMDILLGLVWVTMDFISHCSFNGTASTIFDVLSDSLLCSISQHLSLEAQLLSSPVASDSAHEEWKYDSMQTADTSRTDDSSGHDTASMSAAESDTSGHQLILESSGRGLEEDKEKERECSSKPSKKARLVSDSAAQDRDRADNASPVCLGPVTVSVSVLGPASDTPSDLQALAGTLAKKIAAKDSFNDVISLLYCPDKPTRMSFAKLLLSGFQLLSYADGDAAFTAESEEVREDLLNSDFALKSSVTDSAADRKPLTVTESSDIISALGDDDDDIALAIKLSMEGCPMPSSIDDGDYDSYDASASIPLVVAIPIPSNGQGQGLHKAEASEIGTALDKDEDGDEDVVEMSYPAADFESAHLPVAATATAVAHSSPSSAGVSVSVSTDTAMCTEMEMDIQDPCFGQGSGTGMGSVQVVQAAPLPASARFLLELTRDGRLQLLAENWRRSDAMTWLLLSICQLGGKSKAISPLSSPCLSNSNHKVFLMKRQLIPQLVALFTGDSSLVVGSTVQGPRKTAPSSYVVIGPPSTRGGAPPAASKNIPDWTDLLDCLVALVTSCRTDAMDCWTNDQFSSYSSALTARSPKLDWVSGLSATSRPLYSIALKQCRYSAQTTSLILHLSQNCVSFSDMISDVLLEALFQCSAETTSHVFTVMEAFLTIEDGLVGHRALSMFSGETSPLCMLKGIQDQAPKRRLVCVCISSLMSLLQKVPSVNRTLTVPSSIIQTWAPWMLKFSFIFMNDCLKESSSAAAIKSSYAPSPAPVLHTEGASSSVPAVTVEKGNTHSYPSLRLI